MSDRAVIQRLDYANRISQVAAVDPLKEPSFVARNEICIHFRRKKTKLVSLLARIQNTHSHKVSVLFSLPPCRRLGESGLFPVSAVWRLVLYKKVCQNLSRSFQSGAATESRVVAAGD